MGLFISSRGGAYASKQSGSVLLLSILICAFISVLAILFTKQSHEMLEYRTEIQIDQKARVEAYSFLELALTFLSKSCESDSVPYLNSNTRAWEAAKHANSTKNGLTFYKEIVAPENPNDDQSIEKAIGEYITQCVTKTAGVALAIGEEVKLENRNLEKLKGYLQIKNASGNNVPMIHHKGTQGTFDTYYTFEDLSNKLPLCAAFYKKNKNLINAALRSVSGEYSNSADAMSDYLTADHPKTFHNWNEVQSALGNVNAAKLESLKRLFTIDREVLEHCENRKVNLITAHESLLDVVSNHLGLMTSLKGHARDQSLIKDLGTHPEAKLYTDQTQIFKLGVHVVHNNDSIFQLQCYGTSVGTESSGSKVSKETKPNWSERLGGTHDKKDNKKDTKNIPVKASSRFCFNLQCIEEI
ncbi:MAG: hypothetical protein LW808_000650 [Verrucomicrobiota bacterium]|nr:MAG: hypothetical protein LW808_000650 [Verrucomicrobiota bacterium]